MNILPFSRQDRQLPHCVKSWGWKYHHIGIPTNKTMPNEIYLPKFRFYISGFSSSPYGVEWMRFEEDSPIDELIQTVPQN
jgi:hypothetical protein